MQTALTTSDSFQDYLYRRYIRPQRWHHPGCQIGCLLFHILIMYWATVSGSPAVKDNTAVIFQFRFTLRLSMRRSWACCFSVCSGHSAVVSRFPEPCLLFTLS